MFLLLFLTIVVIKISVTWWNNREIRKIYNKIKFELKYWPIIGHAAYFVGSEEECMKSIAFLGETALKNGGAVGIWLMNKLVHLSADPLDGQFITNSCLEKDESLKVTRTIGFNLLFSPVAVWKPRRKVMVPVFTNKRLMDSAKVHVKHGNHLADHLMSVVGTDFDLCSYIAAYSMDSIGESVLGAEVYAQKNHHHTFIDALFEISKISGLRIVRPWLQNEFFFQFTPLKPAVVRTSDVLTGFVKQHISEKRENLKQKSALENQPDSVLDRMISMADEGKGLGEVALHEETLGLTMAAIDTTTVGITCTLWLLAKHPEVQEKLYAELKDYYGDSGRPVSSEDFPSLKYLDAVMKESLRLYPPVPVIVRKVTQHLTLPSGKKLAPEMAGFVHVQAIHRNRKYWGPDAYDFRPERFLGEINPIAFLPFGRGPRVCIGLHYAQMSMKSALTNVLRRYRFTLPPGSGNEDIRLKFNITSKPVEKYIVRIELRD